MYIARRTPSAFLIILLCLFPAVGAHHFDQCLATIRQLPDGTSGLVDNRGNPVNVSHSATAITYELCNASCGLGSSPFKWSAFSQQFSAWLLPWLALLSQLPFGTIYRFDNVMSVVLTVGSPVLAAYSLALTVLNTQWIARRFSEFKYPNVRHAVRVLSSLQQMPLEISTEHGMLASIVVLPDNDAWWKELTEGLDYIHTWSISAASSIAWVVIAYLFTVIDSFTDISENFQLNGQGVGSVWLWLLPIVIGWLQVSPKCDFDRVFQALKKANTKAFVATSDPSTPALVSHKTSRPAFQILPYRPGSVYRDEESSAPIYNYARFFSWACAVDLVTEAFAAASENVLSNIPVDQNSDWAVGASGEVDEKNRKGSLDDVQRYCGNTGHFDMEDDQEGYTNAEAEMNASKGKLAPGVSVTMTAVTSNSDFHEWRRNVSRWGSDVWTRVFVASGLALFLQWGTTGGAVVAQWFTPTVGLGCRSGSYILYAIVSTVVWILMLLSSVLAHYAHSSRHHSRHSHYHQVADHTAARVSVALRRLGKTLATLNAIWIVMACMFQFSSFFDRCWCDSDMLGLGKRAYAVLEVTEADIGPLRTAWIGAIVLALGSAFAFVGALSLVMDPPLPD